MGARAERFKLLLIATHEPIRVILLLTLLVFGFFALRSWKNANDMIGATNAEIKGTFTALQATLGEINSKVAAIDADKLNRQADDLHAATKAATSLIVSVQGQSERLSGAAAARISDLGPLTASLRATVDEGKRQIAQNGDAAMVLLATLNRTLTDVDTRVSKLLDDGSLMLETANPKLQALLEHADAVVVTADGTIAAYKPVGEHLAGISTNLEAMTADSRNKLHEALYPAPVKGFWPNVKRAAGYLLTPAMDGARIYFQLHSLPVRITQPVPLLKP